MSAHLRPITRRCAVCPKPATVALYNTWNELVNDYCKIHGEQALEKKIEAERAIFGEVQP